jgi:hypothetical protein
MNRLIILLIAIAGMAALWLAWQGAKLWLRRSIRVDQETLNDDRPTLLYFSSPDCAPCHLPGVRRSSTPRPRAPLPGAYRAYYGSHHIQRRGGGSELRRYAGQQTASPARGSCRWA